MTAAHEAAGRVASIRAGWTAERVALLKKRWAKGASANEIARELGGISRNGVIGKANRIGLPSRDSAACTRARHAQDKAARPPVPIGNTTSAPLPPETDAPGSATVLTLTSHCCHWPIGDPGAPNFSFCGRRINDGVYCTEHAKRAYLPKPKNPPSEHRARDDRRYNGRRRFG